jgi:phosphoglucosamine mutase
MLHFGTDGVRGVALEELTVELVRDLARAIARVLQPTGIVIGRDTRESGLALERAIIEGCASEGIAVHLLGVCPTPAIAFAAERYGWVGIAITASHNPWSDNGIKVFASGGHKLDDAEQIDIERVWHSLITDASPTAMGTVHDVSHIIDEYIAHRTHVVGASLSGLTVVLDCANGAMSLVAPAAFRAAAADVVVMADQPDGRNINNQCGATSPQMLAEKVVQVGADLGIAFDGDGDRIIAVSGSGHVIDGDHIMAIAAKDLNERGLLRNKGVAVTVMTNLGFHRAMSHCGIDVIVTPVGDRSVLAALDQYDLVLGGEQSGHIIHRAHATTGDGVLAGVMLMEYLARTGISLDQAASMMQSYPQVLINVRTSERVHDPVSVVGEALESIERELGADGRVLVRSSGTEPLVRVMVEASTVEIAQEKAMNLANILVSVCGGTIEGAH